LVAALPLHSFQFFLFQNIKDVALEINSVYAVARAAIGAFAQAKLLGLLAPIDSVARVKMELRQLDENIGTRQWVLLEIIS
jgi:hypothetical protein